VNGLSFLRGLHAEIPPVLGAISSFTGYAWLHDNHGQQQSSVDAFQKRDILW
jgi:hypothetical protein